MRPETLKFFEFVHHQFPSYFTGCTSLDASSSETTGMHRQYFQHGTYMTYSTAAGKGTGNLTFPNGFFDTIVSSNGLDNDVHYKQLIHNMVRTLKPGGLLAFTCSATQDSAQVGDTFAAHNVKLALPAVFERQQFYYHETEQQLYFWGIKRPPPDTLSAAFARAGCDKSPAFNNYGYYYEPYLAPLRAQHIKLLEIGVAEGKSLQAWREYFYNAPAIVGVDSNPECVKHSDEPAGIYVVIGNQNDFAFLHAVTNTHGPFDIVVDAGSTDRLDKIASFNALFPRLNDHGVYIVEGTVNMRDDLHYFTCYLAQHLNTWRVDGTQEVQDRCVDPDKINLTVQHPVHACVGDIVITNSAILIFKRVKQHWTQKVNE